MQRISLKLTYTYVESKSSSIDPSLSLRLLGTSSQTIGRVQAAGQEQLDNIWSARCWAWRDLRCP